MYRDLIDLYYNTEQRLTLDVQALCRRIIARTNEEATAVQQVLNEFFTETPTGWYHDRCEAEIEAYRANTSQKAMAGKASAEAKRLKKQQALNEASTAVQQPLNPVATEGNGTPTNHQPINQSTNQPKGEQRSASAAPPPKVSKPDDVDPQTWADWLALRKAKKAPVTETVLNGAKREADKAGMTLEAFLQVWCRRGTQGLEADWLKDHERGKPTFAQQAADVARSTVPSRVDRDPVLVERERHDKFGAAPIPPAIREKIAALKGGVFQ